MGRQRNRPQMEKKQENYPEELDKMEASSQSESLE